MVKRKAPLPFANRWDALVADIEQYEAEDATRAPTLGLDESDSDEKVGGVQRPAARPQGRKRIGYKRKRAPPPTVDLSHGPPQPPPLDSPNTGYFGPTVSNIVITFEVGMRNIDRVKVASLLRAKYRPGSFPGVIWHVVLPTATCIVFNTGHHLLLGCRTYREACVVAHSIVARYKAELNPDARLLNMQPRNVVCSASVGPFDIRLFAEAYQSRVVYNPDAFIGLQLCVSFNSAEKGDRHTVYVLFPPGCFVLTGARSYDEHMRMWESACHVMQAYRADLKDCELRWQKIDARTLADSCNRRQRIIDTRKAQLEAVKRMGSTQTRALLRGRSEADFLSYADEPPFETSAVKFWKEFSKAHPEKALAASRRLDQHLAGIPPPVVDDGSNNKKKFKPPTKLYNEARDARRTRRAVLRHVPEGPVRECVAKLLPRRGYNSWWNNPCPEIARHTDHDDTEDVCSHNIPDQKRRQRRPATRTTRRAPSRVSRRVELKHRTPPPAVSLSVAPPMKAHPGATKYAKRWITTELSPRLRGVVMRATALDLATIHADKFVAWIESTLNKRLPHAVAVSAVQDAVDILSRAEARQ